MYFFFSVFCFAHCLHSVVHQNYKVQVHDEFVIRGNGAVFRCHIPTFVREFVQVIGWFKDEQLIISSLEPHKGII